jgi:hypothetical protein
MRAISRRLRRLEERLGPAGPHGPVVESWETRELLLRLETARRCESRIIAECPEKGVRLRIPAFRKAFMWRSVKDWLANGAVPDDEHFAQQLGSPGYHINRSNKLVIEAKQEMQKRGLASPDDADALALTFARPRAACVPLIWCWNMPGMALNWRTWTSGWLSWSGRRVWRSPRKGS